MKAESLLCKDDSLEPRDFDLLRSLAAIGMYLPAELAGDPDLGMDEDEVKVRLERLAAAGYVKGYFTATVEGSAVLLRAKSDLSGHKARIPANGNVARSD